MKTLITFAMAIGFVPWAFGQGTVVFNNRVVGSAVTHVYAPNSNDYCLRQIGNGSNDTPSGSTSWAGFTPIGANGTGGQYGGFTTFAQLIAAPGANQPEGSLVPATPATTFRTGATAGFVAGTTVTLANVPQDAPVATIEMVAWDNSTGNYPTWTQARAAWLAGAIAAGESGTFNVANIGGLLNSPPSLVGLQSFNIAFGCPEPSTFALGALGALLFVLWSFRK